MLDTKDNFSFLEITFSDGFYEIYAEGVYIEDGARFSLGYFSPRLSFGDCLRETNLLMKIYGCKPKKFVLNGDPDFFQRNTLFSLRDRGCRNS